MATFRPMTERVLILQPRTLAEVDAERAERGPALHPSTWAALEAVWSKCTLPPPPVAPPPTATTPTRAPTSTRTRSSGRRSSRARQVAPPTARPAAPAPPKAAAAPSLPLRFFDPDDPEPDYGAPFRRGYEAMLEERAHARRFPRLDQ